MGKGSYLGGHSRIFLSEGGTRWETQANENLITEEFYKRWDKRDEYELDKSVQERKRQCKEFTYFIRACAEAFSDETLSKDFPPPPGFLRKAIKRAGGNVKWLSSDRTLLKLLTQMQKSALMKRVTVNHSDQAEPPR